MYVRSHSKHTKIRTFSTISFINIIFITFSGAGLGIGRAIARIFGASGCDMVLCDIDEAAAEQVRILGS